ncbi:type II secretion system F family protein [Candidatus Sumerlaeota bacterium]|nr:type II secretion system F family protein [Candidatus Sumerlaeota bacterium]
MAVFQYVAKNESGQTVTGSTEAPTQSIAARQLRDQGLVPIQIQAGQLSAAQRRRARGKGGKVKLSDLVIFSRQLAVMVRAGLPLLEVLNILQDQMEKRSFRSVLAQVERDVKQGSSLTEAMKAHPKVFDLFFLNMIRAGEASGMLDNILDQVAGYLEKIASLRRKVISAIVYPLLVSLAATGITIFLLTYVVPVFKEIFDGFGAPLPIMTRVIISVSDMLVNYWYIFVAVIVILVIFIWQWGKTRSGRFTIDRFKLKVPIFGQLFLKVAISRFSRTLATLIRAGVNILAALDIVSKTAGNLVIEEAIAKTRVSVQSGETFTKPLVDAGCFPPMVTRMIDVGERTGQLESMLSKIADFYEDQVDAMVSALTSIIEPLLIIFLGVLVGFVVISMFLPLFKMLEHIN